MVAVSGDLEAPLALGTNTMQLHELLHSLLADQDALPPPRLGVQGLKMHQQRLVAQALPLGIASTAHQMRVVARHANLQHPALHRDKLGMPVALDEGVLQIDSFAKYAVIFPKMSRLIFARASSARSRLISICSAFTGCLYAPVSLPCRWALTQLNCA